MKILFFSYTFGPNIGGIESVSAILAEKFAEAGHEVELVTETAEKENVQPAFAVATAGRRPTPNVQRPIYKITRKPSTLRLIRLLHWCDLLFQNNISLRSLIPALLMQKRVIVVHQTWLRNVRRGIGWNNRVKRSLLRFVTNVAISEAIRDDITLLASPSEGEADGAAGCSRVPVGRAHVSHSETATGLPARGSQMPVIGNPYDDRVFRLRPEVTRDKTLVFVGRLVSDKGIDLLLGALKLLCDQALSPDLTIIGVGPEEGTLRQLTHELGLDRQVTFGGEKSGEELAATLNRHQIMVVPSRWAEPFGIVALEGIACGCVIVGSRDGGLREAIGSCGLTFKNGDERELADCVKTLLLDPQRRAVFQKDASAHLIKFRADSVARDYIELINAIAH